jgi:hypothetical protein
MRGLCIGIGAAALLLAGVASAAPINWEGTSTTILADYPPGVLTGGGVATVNGSSGVLGAHLNTFRQAASRGQISGTFTSLVTDPETIGNGVAAIVYSGVRGGTGSNTHVSGGAASTLPGSGTLPVGGVVKVCILTTSCEVFLPVVLTQPTITVNGEPGSGIKGVGVGGLVTAGGGTDPIRISLQGAPWTIKTATSIDHITTTGGNQEFIAVVHKGFAHGPASGTTSTAQVSGVLQLVTPSQTTTNLPFGSSVKQAGHTIALIHFVPEPGLLLLIGSGVTGLALLGRRRLKK